MEVEQMADRAHLWRIMQQHPEWSIRDIHREICEDINRSWEWTRKWYQRLLKADPNDGTALMSRSRRRKTPYAMVSEEVEMKIIHLRDTLSQQYHRRVGAKNIIYHLQQDDGLKWKKLPIPTSTSTVTKILHKYRRIPIKIPKDHIPRDPAEPMQVMEIDFADVITARSEQTEKKAHQVEAFVFVDAGTSIVHDIKIDDEFNAETALVAVSDRLMRGGLPKRVRLDRDPRLIGSWNMDKFPSAFMRFLLCLGINLDICPPRRPDLKPYAERFIRSYKEESVYRDRPHDVITAQISANDYVVFYNLERPNQAVTCGNRPPSLALSDPPYLPRLPQAVDPDRWLEFYHQQGFKRQVRSNGYVNVDKNRYYIGQKFKGQKVWMRLHAETKQFEVILGEKIIKKMDIKGLYHGEMTFGDYFELIKKEARSEERRLNQKRRFGFSR